MYLPGRACAYHLLHTLRNLCAPSMHIFVVSLYPIHKLFSYNKYCHLIGWTKPLSLWKLCRKISCLQLGLLLNKCYKQYSGTFLWGSVPILHTSLYTACHLGVQGILYMENASTTACYYRTKFSYLWWVIDIGMRNSNWKCLYNILLFMCYTHSSPQQTGYKLALCACGS